MKRIMKGIKQFAADESGATALEYGLMVALIAVAIVVTVSQIGTELNTTFTTILDCLKAPKTCGATG